MTRSPISCRESASCPFPSPSPEGSPESSNRALKDSMCGATNSVSMGTEWPVFGGQRKRCSRSSVLKPLYEPSGILAFLPEAMKKTRRPISRLGATSTSVQKICGLEGDRRFRSLYMGQFTESGSLTALIDLSNFLLMYILTVSLEDNE